MSQLLVSLEASDSRERWLAAKALGQGLHAEAVPYLLQRLADRNLEVRHRSMDALLAIGRKKPHQFQQLFEAGLRQLDPVTTLVANGLLGELRGRRDRARTYMHRAFTRDKRRLWAAYRAYGTSLLLRKVERPLGRNIEITDIKLRREIAHPKATYPQSLLRRAYALIVFTQAIRRRVAPEITARYAAGNRRQTNALRAPLARLLSSARELSRTAKSIEIQLFKRVRGFKFSDYDPAKAKEISLAGVRAQAARKLAVYRTAAVRAALTRALELDPSSEVRAAAALSLGQDPDPTNVDALLRAFDRDKNMQVKLAAIRALGNARNPKARALIYRVVRKPEYKEAAVLALGRQALPTDLAFLRRASHDPKFYTLVDRSLGLVSRDQETILTAMAQAFELAAKKKEGAEAEALSAEAKAIRERLRRLDAGPETPVDRSHKEPQPKPATRAKESADIRRRLAAWIQAWQQGDFKRFMGYYHPDFRHRGMNRSQYLAYKRRAAKKHGKLAITIHDLRIRVRGSRARVTFLQDYVGQRYRDFGLKTLEMAKAGGVWLIKRETWQKRKR